jgi:hypothetical protein
MQAGFGDDHSGEGMPDQHGLAILPIQHEPSANRPCTRTTLRAAIGAGFAARLRVEIDEAAAPPSNAAEKVRLFMMVICSSLVRFSVQVSGADTMVPHRRSANATL